MKELHPVLNEYLADTGMLESISGEKLGERKERRVTKDRNDDLAKTLRDRRTLAGRIMVVMVILACLLFGVLILSPFYYCKFGHPIILIAPAGGLGFLSWILSYLRRLSVDLDRLALLMSILYNLPPEKAAMFINQFHWNLPRQKR